MNVPDQPDAIVNSRTSGISRRDRWPFRPTRVVADPPEGQTGILGYQLLLGIHSHMSHVLEHPLTVVEFDITGSPRISDACDIVVTIHHPYELIHKRVSTPRTPHRCDARHATVFQPQSIRRLDRRTLLASPHWKDLEHFHRSRGGLISVVELDDDSVAIQYDCVHLGYREISFPIVVEERVLGTLNVRGICLHSAQERILDLHHSFGKTHSRYFEEYCRENPPATPESVAAEILTALEQWTAQPRRWFDERQYAEFTNRARGQVIELESLLARQLEAQRLLYVNKHASRIIHSLRPVVGTDDEALGRLWSNVNNAVQDIVPTFGIRYLTIFGPTRTCSNHTVSLSIVAKAGRLPKNIENNLTAFDPRKIPQRYLLETGDSRYVPSSGDNSAERALADAFVPTPQSDWGDYRVITIPMVGQNLHLCLVIGYSDNNLSDSLENRRGGFLDAPLRSFYGFIRFNLSSILASAAERRTTDIFRFYGHEAAQLTGNMTLVLSNYLNPPRRAVTDPRVDAGRLAEVGSTIESLVNLLHLLHTSAGVLTPETHFPRISKTRFLPLGTLFYKWKSIYRLQLKRLGMALYLPPANRDDPSRPHMYADIDLLQIVLYNLIGNALKYAWRGTMIELNCETLDPAKPDSPYLISVSDYGRAFEGERKAFDLYYRGKNVDDQNGLGIGLFIAEKLVAAHGGSIDVTSTFVSSFNVPLIEPYLGLPPQVADRDLTKRIERELPPRKREELISKVVARDHAGLPLYRPNQSDILAAIEKRTYAVTVHVRLPSETIGRGGVLE